MHFGKGFYSEEPLSFLIEAARARLDGGGACRGLHHQ